MKKLLLSLFLLSILKISFAQSGINKPSVNAIRLKNFILNENALTKSGLLTKSKKLKKEQLASFSLSKLDEVYSPGYVYHLIDTLYKSGASYIVLLGRGSENENIVWLASYTTGKKLIDHKQVYYDNAEGFLLVETVIKNNTVSIKTINEYDDNKKVKTERYRFTSSFQLQKIQ